MSWYDDQNGVRFECTQCGACCRRPGVILMTPVDVLRISAHLAMSPQDFKARYLMRYDEVHWSVQVEEGRPCVFLSAEQACTIQPVKPWQCDAYPFWQEVVGGAVSWHEEAIVCEGIGQGRLHPPEDIRQWLAEDPLAEDEPL